MDEQQDDSSESTTESNMKYFLALCVIFVTSCNSQLIDAVIIGSAETPDPVLEKVIELEKKGVLVDVVIMESFPVQIRVRASQEIIDELKAMPRVISPSFR